MASTTATNNNVIDSNENKKINWWIFLALALAVAMVDFDMTAVNLAIADISNDLNMSLTSAQWVINGYTIAAASMMALAGRLGDKFGLNRVFLYGLAAFCLFSLLVGLSIGPYSIIVFRILQGACIAFTFPITIGIVRFSFPAEKIGLITSLLISTAGLAQAFGPSFGSLIIHFSQWRYIFLINVPLSMIAWVLAKKFIKPIQGESTTIKTLPAALLTASLLLIVSALNGASNFGFTFITFLSLLTPGLALMILFVRIERKEKDPLLDVKLLTNSYFLQINVIRILLNFTYFTLIFILSLMLHNILEWSTLKTGETLLCMTLVFGVLSIPVGKLIDTIGFKLPICIGSLLLMLACFLLNKLSLNTTMSDIMIPLVIAGIAIALLIPASGVAAMMYAPAKKTKSALRIFFTNGFIGASLGVGISGLILNQVSLFALTNKMAELLSRSFIGGDVDAYVHNAMLYSSFFVSGMKPLSSSHKALFTQTTLGECFFQGFSVVMLTCAFLMLISFLLSIGLYRKSDTFQ